MTQTSQNIRWLTELDRRILSSQDEVNSVRQSLVEASTHLSIFLVTLNTQFYISFYAALIFHKCKVSWISPPPSLFSSLFLFLYVPYCTPSSLFILPCVFLSPSFNLCLLSSPLFPLSYLTISQDFAPPHLLFSSLLLQTCSKVF